MSATATLQRHGGSVWTVSGALDMASVPAVIEDAVKQWANESTITVDLGNVMRIDSSALALLIEWRRQADRSQRTLTMRNAPKALESMAELCGVAQFLPPVVAT